MAASQRTEPVQGAIHPHLAALPAIPSAPVPRPRWRLNIRPELPAMLVVVLLVAWGAFTLYRAHEEGLACGARGGVIMEIDEHAYDSAQVKLCTADY